MSIDELKQTIKDLRELQNAIMDLNYHMEVVEDLCGQVGIEGSHHADMEYGRTECAVDEALQQIEYSLELMGVTV